MKREDNDQMKATILDAVIACKIAASGATVSLSQISSKANISERTLNRYFPDKEILVYDAAIRHLTQLYLALEAHYLAADQTGMNGLERLLLLIRLQVQHNLENPSSAKVFVRAYTTAMRTALYRDLPVTGHDAPIRKLVIRCIEDGMQDGSMRQDLIPLDIYLLISSNYMGLVQRMIYFYSVDFTKEEHKQELTVVFHQYIRMLEEYLSARGRQG